MLLIGQTMGKSRSVNTANEVIPALPHGGDRKTNQVDNYNLDKTKGGTSAEYLTRKIARDRPDILERMKAGEFRSVRQAAIEAGIIKPKPTVAKTKDYRAILELINASLTEDEKLALAEEMAPTNHLFGYEFVILDEVKIADLLISTDMLLAELPDQWQWETVNNYLIIDIMNWYGHALYRYLVYNKGFSSEEADVVVRRSGYWGNK